MLSDADIEKMARAAYEQWQSESHIAPKYQLKWNKLHPVARASWLRQQRAAVEALKAKRSKANGKT